MSYCSIGFFCNFRKAYKKTFNIFLYCNDFNKYINYNCTWKRLAVCSWLYCKWYIGERHLSRCSLYTCYGSICMSGCKNERITATYKRWNGNYCGFMYLDSQYITWAVLFCKPLYKYIWIGYTENICGSIFTYNDYSFDTFDNNFIYGYQKKDES